jgi:soluble lytic murein transglycosylase-like protein
MPAAAGSRNGSNVTASPRDPKVDPIDWVERPFPVTRNYVQRIVESIQVYRVRFGGGKRLLIHAARTDSPSL